MCTSKVAYVLGIVLLSSAFAATNALGAHDPCKVLTAERAGEIIGPAVTVDKATSNETNCYYSGPGRFGAQFPILSESASPQMDAMLNRRGSEPPSGSGMVEGSYREGTIFFSFSMKSTDQIQLRALVAEIRKNLR